MAVCILFVRPGTTKGEQALTGPKRGLDSSRPECETSGQGMSLFIAREAGMCWRPDEDYGAPGLPEA